MPQTSSRAVRMAFSKSKLEYKGQLIWVDDQLAAGGGHSETPFAPFGSQDAAEVGEV
jgi:hypothetical protein